MYFLEKLFNTFCFVWKLWDQVWESAFDIITRVSLVALIFLRSSSCTIS